MNSQLTPQRVILTPVVHNPRPAAAPAAPRIAFGTIARPESAYAGFGR